MTRRLCISHDRDHEELKHLIDFFERRRYVARMLVPPGYEDYFRDRARYISAQTSVAIEEEQGNVAEARMTVLAYGDDQEAPTDSQAARNAEFAYQLIDELHADGSLVIDQGIMRTFNSILLRGLPDPEGMDRGRYRVGGAQIVDSLTRAVRYTPPPPEWVPELMNNFETDLQQWMQDDVPAVAAAKAHFELISIHPFRDGNGRTARLVADLILRNRGWAADGMISVNSVILQQREAYYSALRDTQGPEFVDAVDATAFILFHTRALTQAAIGLEEQAVEFGRRKDKLMAAAGGQLNERQVIGLMYMFDMGPLASSTYARLNRCSQPTALADLQSLVQAGFATRFGTGRSTRYGIQSKLLEDEPNGNREEPQ